MIFYYSNNNYIIKFLKFNSEVFIIVYNALLFVKKNRDPKLLITKPSFALSISKNININYNIL